MEMRRDIFQALADPTRRTIVSLIATKAMTPGAIAASFDFSRQTISKHIQILTECQLVRQEQKGREIYYYFKPEKMKEVADWVNQYSRFWNDKFNSLDKYLDKIQSKNKSKK